MIDPIFVSLCAVLCLLIAGVALAPRYHKVALYTVVILWAVSLALIHAVTP